MGLSENLLQQLGFGDYEARTYVALLQGGPATGYQVAKASGIPRPNIYEVLKKLEARGAVVSSEGTTGTRYMAVPSEVLLRDLEGGLSSVLDRAKRALQSPQGQAGRQYITQARGYLALIEKARIVVRTARSRLYVFSWRREASMLANDFSAAVERGVRIDTFCAEACSPACGNCCGSIYREYRLAPERGGRWLLMVADNKELFLGALGTGDNDLVVCTQQPLIVDIAARFLCQNMSIAALLSDLGKRLPEVASPGTVALNLAMLGAGEPGSGWLERLGQALDVYRMSASREEDAGPSGQLVEDPFHSLVSAQPAPGS
ncbi:MAG: TrmB family transcriptional regulator [Chloroflexi bacterium]|nr:TrmB family transcriptional regulator [Chloroflexota bacterium]